VFVTESQGRADRAAFTIKKFCEGTKQTSEDRKLLFHLAFL
jgi:hypothetical protein